MMQPLKQRRLVRKAFIAAILVLLVASVGLGIAFHQPITAWIKKQFPTPEGSQELAVSIPVYVAFQIASQNETKFQQYQAQIKPCQDISLILQDMVYIQGGNYKIGSQHGDPDETIQAVVVPNFWLDTYEISNAKYWQFCKATSYPMPSPWKEKGWDQGIPKEFAEYPVVNVSFYDASLYAYWAGKRLPTDLELAYAAQSKDGDYPWGGKYSDIASFKVTEYANINTGKIGPVHSYPKGRNSIGIFNLAGNVWEWTATPFGDYQENMAIKGGSFRSNYYQARASYHNGFLKHSYRNDLGFRCALDDRSEKK